MNAYQLIEWYLIAWSGLGMVRNCCGGDTFMPEIYTRTLLSVPSSDWNYSLWIPDVVVINLGTNDNLNGASEGTVEQSYVDTYAALIRNISLSYYASRPPVVFLACGPMSEEYCPYVFQVIDILQKENNPNIDVHFLDQRNVLTLNNQCCGHPDAAADITLAELTSTEIASIMKW